MSGANPTGGPVTDYAAAASIRSDEEAKALPSVPFDLEAMGFGDLDDSPHEETPAAPVVAAPAKKVPAVAETDYATEEEDLPQEEVAAAEDVVEDGQDETVEDEEVVELPSEALELTQTLSAQIADLQQRLAEAEAANKKEVEEVIEVQDFIPDDETFDRALSNPKEFNKVLNSVYEKAYRAGREKTIVELTKTIQPMVQETVLLQTTLAAMYQSNPDLVTVIPTVQLVLTELHQKNPKMDIRRLIAAVPAEVRKRIARVKPVANVGAKKNVQAAPPRGGRRVPAVAQKPVEFDAGEFLGMSAFDE